MRNSFKERNILLLIPSLGIGGAENALCKISLELAKVHRVHICIFNKDIPIGFPFGGKLISLDIPGGTSVFEKVANFWKRIQKVKNLKKQLSIDVSISFLEGADFINILSKGKEKVIISIRSSKTHNESIIGHFDFIRNKVLIPNLYSKADAIVAVQKNIVAELTDVFTLPKKKIFVINNYFDQDYILTRAKESIAEELQSFFQSPVIIASGRLNEVKGFSYLIRAFAHFAKARPHVKLCLMGDGPLRESLETQARSTGLNVSALWNEEEQKDLKETNILFLGHQSNPYKFISRSLLFTMSSLSEGFPNAMAEAMVCGVPVVSTDCPYGPREILAPGTEAVEPIKEAVYVKYGILLPLFGAVEESSAIDVWSETFEILFNDHNMLKRYAALAQTRIEDFSKESIMTQWEALIA